ncbi:MAG: lactate utilization protein C [Pseudomonadota bacterium]
MMGRDAILGRIRAAVGRSGNAPAEVRQRAEQSMQQHATGPQGGWPGEVLERLRACAEKLSSTVDVVAATDDVPAAVARYLLKQGLPTGGVCWPTLRGLPWIAAGLGMEGRAIRPDDLVGVTGCFCAIADTGTLMMLSGPNTPAATSLLPETHIAVVPVSRIVRHMEDAWALLRKEKGGLPRAVNFVSGPSRTADIEQTVTLGAHGPYRVHLILVKGA